MSFLSNNYGTMFVLMGEVLTMADRVMCDVETLMKVFYEEMRTGASPSLALVNALSAACATTTNAERYQTLACADATLATTAGARLKMMRKLRGLTLADFCDIVSRSHLCDYENGKKDYISERMLERICARLNIRTAWVLEGELPIEQTKNPATHTG